jgi:hypothetical protein
MKTCLALLSILIFSISPIYSQGLIEQNKFYPEKLNIHLFRLDTNEHVGTIITDSLRQANQADILALSKQIEDLNNSLKENLAKDEKISTLQKQVELFKKQILGMMATRYAESSADFQKQFTNYLDEIKKHEKNIKSLREKSDTLNDPRLQWYKDSCAFIYSDMVRELKTRLDSLNQMTTSLNKRIKGLDTAFYAPHKLDTTNFSKVELSCNVLVQKTGAFITNRLKTLDDSIDKFVDKFNTTYNSKVKAITEKGKNTELSTLPGFSSLLDNPEFIPVVSIIAGSGFKHKSAVSDITGSVNLFASAEDGSTKDTAEFEIRKKLFIPTTSKWGLSSVFTFGWWPDQKKEFNHFGLNIGTNFLGRKYHSDSIKEFNTNIFNLKIGAEWAFFKNLSVYGNFNTMSFLSNINSLNNYLGVERNKTYTYFDVGSKFYLDIMNQSGFNLFLDVNLVFISPLVHEDLFKFKDPAIPNIKVGLRKSLK